MKINRINLKNSFNKAIGTYLNLKDTNKKHKMCARKIVLFSSVLAVFSVFSTVVSADTKVGCVDIFDAINHTEKSITLKWDRGINADGYVVYRADSPKKDTYREVIRIANGEITSFIDATVEAGKSYVYKIQSYTNTANNISYSKSEYVNTASSPTKVDNVKVGKSTDTTTSISWDNVLGATGYTVFRMDYSTNGEYKKICDLKAGEKYVDTNLTPSRKYYYKIYAYKEVSNERSYSLESDIIKTATNPAQVKTLKVSKKSQDSITINWDKSQNATGYVVYRMTHNENDYEGKWVYDDTMGWIYSSDVGKYVKYAVIKNNKITKYTDKDLNYLQGYNYKVVPYFYADEKYYYGKSTVISTGTVTNTPEVTGFSRDSRVMAKWYPVDGAEGYAIYMSESKNGHYKFQGTTEDTIYLTKQITTNKDYYLRVCAYYTNYDKTKVLSNFTTEKIKCVKENKVDTYSVDNTYIEIDLDMQHMWYFEKGKLVISTDVVTGMKYSHDTTTGLYEVYYKESPARLVGEDWDTMVDYWMAVTYDGIGIHDSVWRWDYEYGGNTYTYNGSHGCINTPYSKVKEMYERVKIGTPVVVYEKS